jgi:hypothetical protein
MYWTYTYRYNGEGELISPNRGDGTEIAMSGKTGHYIMQLKWNIIQ